MKILLMATALLFVVTVNFAQIKMNSTGNVALGYSPTTVGTAYKVYSSTFYTGNTMTLGGYASDIILDFVGYGERRMRPSVNNRGSVGTSTHAFNKMYSYSFITISDRRQKENIKPLTGGLEIIKNLRGVTYDFKREYMLPKDREMNSDQMRILDKERKNEIGFIAQEVEKVLPDVVIYDDSSDVYAIDYLKLVPVLVEAIKEQQNTIDNLLALTSKLKEDNSGEDFIQNQSDKGFKLFQNNPNPSDGSTEIRYEVPAGTTNGSVRVYDLNGKQVKSYSLNNSNSVVIENGELVEGIYLYSLIVNGKEKGMKKMIIGQ